LHRPVIPVCNDLIEAVHALFEFNVEVHVFTLVSRRIDIWQDC
jgi:hypothetical protein